MNVKRSRTRSRSLRSIANPTDAISFRRIINTPPRGIGKVTLDKIIGIGKESGLTNLRGHQRGA